MRLEELCAWIADELHLDQTKKNNVVRAAYLSKADLVSGMVGEFDTLQGIMGGIYAEKTWREQNSCRSHKRTILAARTGFAITPKARPGRFLAIADKADTIAGCFGLNKIPTGAADPNGLRRCALGIIRIIIAFNFNVSLQELFKNAYIFYGSKDWKLDLDERQAKIIAFLKDVYAIIFKAKATILF